MAWTAVFFALALCAVASGQVCKSPKLFASNHYTTADGMVVTNVAFIVEFELKCQNDDNVPLYGEVEGNIQPVLHTGHNKYQFSWTIDAKKVYRGEYVLSIYDEDSYSKIRKAIRNGEAYKNVIEPLQKLSLHYNGVYTGPWINSELLATTLAIGGWYVAFHNKRRL